MSAKIICMSSPKGGSGKTIITANFCCFLTSMGYKCLIVDCDAATHGMTLLYLNEVTQKLIAGHGNSGIFDTQPISLDGDLVTIENGIDLLPATYSFKVVPTESNFDIIAELQILLADAKNIYDFIFLDTQAGTDKISRIAMSSEISDEVVIVSEYDPLSAAGVERMKAVLSNELDFTRTWVLLNKMLPEFVEKFSDFLSVAKYLSPIPWNADVVRSYARKQLAIDTEFGNEYTLAIMQCLRSLLGEDFSKDIDKWTDSKAELIRQPIAQQYQDAERELLSLHSENRKTESLRESKARIRSVILVLSMMIWFALIFLTFEISDTLKNRSSDIEVFMFAAGMFSVPLVAFSLFKDYFLFGKKTPEDAVEEARFSRKIGILNERLKQLEALQKADFDTLIKSNEKKTFE